MRRRRWRSIVRLLAFVGKELVEIAPPAGRDRQPDPRPVPDHGHLRLGYSGYQRPLETVVVVPPSRGLPTDVETYQELAGGGLHIVEVTADRAAAEARLARRARSTSSSSPRPTPRRSSAPASSPSSRSWSTSSTRSRRTTRASSPRASPAPSTARSSSAPRRGPGLRRRGRASPRPPTIPPEVVAAPTRAEVGNIAPSTPHVLAFFGPAVLALILQHLAVTLVALSLVRERTSGVIELFRDRAGQHLRRSSPARSSPSACSAARSRR